MIEGFKEMAKDPEILAMTEEGMNDYWEIIKKFENSDPPPELLY